METVVNSKKPENDVIEQAVEYLKRGGMVIYPTETSYGLGVDATNAAAVRRLFVFKGRKSTKSLPVIVGTMAAAERLVKFSSCARALAKKYWPGPLVLVLPVRASARLAPGVQKDKTVALRISSHPVARALAQRLGRPLVATSANLSDRPACYSLRAIKKQFSGIEDVLVLNAGRLPKRAASTIVQDGTVLRQGAIRI